MAEQFEDIINNKIQNLTFKNQQYIANNPNNCFEYWKKFWNIFEEQFQDDFIIKKPNAENFTKRVIYLETQNRQNLKKYLFILSLPEAHMLEKPTQGKILARLRFRNSLLKKYIANSESVFMITFYAPLKRKVKKEENNLLNLIKATDFDNSVMIISGLKEIWNSSEKYGTRYLMILDEIKDETKKEISIRVKFSEILNLLLDKKDYDLQPDIIFKENGKITNVNALNNSKHYTRNQSFNLVKSENFNLVKDYLIKSNEDFIQWIENYQMNKIVESKTLFQTEKHTLVKARINQGKFRKDLLKIYKKCPISKISEPDLLIASHIKPWSESKHEEEPERLDPDNDFLLSALIDKMFDSGLITFADDSKIVFSKKLSLETINYLSLNENTTYDLKLNSKRKKYLDFHRRKIFKK